MRLPLDLDPGRVHTIFSEKHWDSTDQDLELTANTVAFLKLQEASAARDSTNIKSIRSRIYAPFRSFFHWKTSSVTRPARGCWIDTCHFQAKKNLQESKRYPMKIVQNQDQHTPLFKRRNAHKNPSTVKWKLCRIQTPIFAQKTKEPNHKLSNDGPHLQRQLASAGFCPFVLKTLSNSFNLSFTQACGNGMAHLNRIGLRHPGQPLATVIPSAHL